ncbi:MAG: hypothetical protein R6V54_12525 [Desulfobacteraceae bacterium]
MKRLGKSRGTGQQYKKQGYGNFSHVHSILFFPGNVNNETLDPTVGLCAGHGKRFTGNLTSFEGKGQGIRFTGSNSDFYHPATKPKLKKYLQKSSGMITIIISPSIKR